MKWTALGEVFLLSSMQTNLEIFSGRDHVQDLCLTASPRCGVRIAVLVSYKCLKWGAALEGLHCR